MKASGPQIISMLREQLQQDIGRHMYGVLGSYECLARFETDDLAQARDAHGVLFPKPLNLNRELLSRIGDDDLRQLVKDEARRPQSVQDRLNRELNGFLRDAFSNSRFIILKQLEILFAYGLDFGVLRTHASDQYHMLLLLPGERRSDHLVIFHEAQSDFHREIPMNLVADNHLWELADG